MNNTYRPDILGHDFENLVMHFPDDYEGKVVATLIRRKAEQITNKAILYIHGFNDYFFQEELAERFNGEGYDFYALDLRKYGRSWLPHQKLNNVRDLKEYDAELLEALALITQENHDKIILMGHSTGGLIATYFLSRHRIPYIHGLILNSPFYDFNLSGFKKNIMIPIGAALGKFFPNIEVDPGLTALYGKGLHIDYEGEWSYNLTWKPIIPPHVNLSFIHAIRKAQKTIQNGVNIMPPVLLLSSDKSSHPTEMNKRVFTTDIVLDVTHIKNIGSRIQGDVQYVPITHGIHDLILSNKIVRDNVYHTIFNFIRQLDQDNTLKGKNL